MLLPNDCFDDSIIQKEKSMFFLVLRPMTWDEFIGSMVTLQIKYRFSSFPQPRPQVRITALPNGVGHLPALWRTKGVSHMGGRHVQFQQNPALRQTDMFWRK